MLFPSREWFEAAAAALARDPLVMAANADFGQVVVGVVITRGAGLSDDFCVLVRIEPGKPFQLRYPDDEDEVAELEPDYICWAPYAVCKSFLQTAQAGGRPDLLKAVLSGQMKLQGDLQRVVRHGARHQGAGAATLRALPTEFV
ncbi:MAG TPA: hypothetical protein VGH20_05885 [Myxococcales bacterium]